jgi:leader peptidase (prepilin peptidase)/N-methyltransferase
MSGTVALMLGPIIGSFVGAAAIRAPRRETVVHGRSRCDSCRAALTAIELIPIISYITQRGRCRRCNATIAMDQIVAEIGGAIIAILALISAPDIAAAIALALFGWVLLALALLDVRHLWLPDALTLPLIATGVVVALVIPAIELTDRVAGAVVGYAVLEGVRRCYRRLRGREGLGGGDAKLFAAIGAWLGVTALPWVMIVAGLGGLTIVGAQRLRVNTLGRDDRLPLGTFLAVAALIVMPFVLADEAAAFQLAG